MLSILIAIALPMSLGFLVITVLLANDHKTGLIERIALSWPLGAGLLTIQMFLMGLLRVSFERLPLSLPILVEIIGLSIWIKTKAIPVITKPSSGLWAEFSSSETKLIKKIAMAVLLIWVCAKIGSVFLEASLRPIWAWDSWANWSVGGKLYFYTGGLMLDAPAQDFFTKGAVSRMPSYPPHNPLLQAWMAIWLGRFDEVLAKFWQPFYFLSMAVLLYHVAAKAINRFAGLALTVLFTSSRLMSYHAVEAYSDLSVGVCHLMALYSFIRAMEKRGSWWILVGTFSAIALFIKSESPGFVGPLMLSALLYIWMNRKEPGAAGSLLRIGLPLLLAAPWFLFKAMSNLHIFQDYLAESPAPLLGWHAAESLPRVASEFLSLQNFNILLVSFPLLLLANGKPSKELFLAAFPVLSYALFFVAIYTVITHYFEVLMIGTVFYRNVLTYYPALCLVTIMVLRELRQKLAAASAVNRSKRQR